MNGSPALVVIDVQCAAFDGEMLPVIPLSRELLDRTAGLIGAARDAGVPVIYLQHAGTSDEVFSAGTVRAEIHPSIAPRAADTVIQKSKSSGFEGTRLKGYLDEQGIDSIIACGLQSEFCVSNTCLAALDLGLNVYVAEDGHGTWPTDDDSAASIVERSNAMLAERGAVVERADVLIRRMNARRDSSRSQPDPEVRNSV